MRLKFLFLVFVYNEFLVDWLLSEAWLLCSYEPELHPGVTYRIKSPKATLKIFSTGSITVTGKCAVCFRSDAHTVHGIGGPGDLCWGSE